MRCFALADEGSRPSVDIGEVFALALPETPTTGYRWTISELAAPVSMIEDEFTAPDSMLPGAGGVRQWHFRAERPGTGVLRADLVRRSDATPARSFDLTIEVAAQ